LDSLKALGSLPTKVLGDTLIGITINKLAKSTGDENVRASAKALVGELKSMFRKRKSSASIGDAAEKQPPLKRFSSTASDLSKVEESPREMARPVEKVQEEAMPPNGEAKPAEEAAPAALEPHREKVLKKLVEALGKEEEIETKGDNPDDEDHQRDPVVLAGEIEAALFIAMPKKETYLGQARSVIYNLKDPKNPTFRFKLSVGFFKPSDVPRLTAEEMASDEKNAERAAQRKYAMEEIQSDWAIRNGQQRICGMFTCGKCKGTRTTYFQMQTRSSDEPMTTFVTCLTCNNRWKFC